MVDFIDHLLRKNCQNDTNFWGTDGRRTLDKDDFSIHTDENPRRFARGKMANVNMERFYSHLRITHFAIFFHIFCTMWTHGPFSKSSCSVRLQIPVSFLPFFLFFLCRYLFHNILKEKTRATRNIQNVMFLVMKLIKTNSTSSLKISIFVQIPPPYHGFSPQTDQTRLSISKK